MPDRNRRFIATDPKIIETYQLPARSLMREDLQLAVDRAMGQILDHQVDIIRMVVDEQMTFEQIGRHYGITRHSAHGRYTRAKKALREEMMNHDLIRAIIDDE